MEVFALRLRYVALVELKAYRLMVYDWLNELRWLIDISDLSFILIIGRSSQ